MLRMPLKTQAAAPQETVALKPPSRLRPMAFGMAAFLGILSGFLPWLCVPNTLIALTLLYVRMPVWLFALCFGAAKLLLNQYLEHSLSALGWSFLTSPATNGIAVKLAQAPILCFFQWHQANVMGGMLAGVMAGIPAWLLISAFVKRQRRAGQKA